MLNLSCLTKPEYVSDFILAKEGGRLDPYLKNFWLDEYYAREIRESYKNKTLGFNDSDELLELADELREPSNEEMQECDNWAARASEYLEVALFSKVAPNELFQIAIYQKMIRAIQTQFEQAEDGAQWSPDAICKLITFANLLRKDLPSCNLVQTPSATTLNS